MDHDGLAELFATPGTLELATDEEQLMGSVMAW